MIVDNGVLIEGGKVYLAPADTEPPTSTSKAALEAAGWRLVGKVEDDGTITDTRPAVEATETTKHWSLEVDYQLPEPYRPNRADRRAAARAAKRGQR